MKVELIKHPTTADWLLAKQCALVTVNKKATTEPSLEWKKKILEARHSPIRVLEFAFYGEMPSYVSVHLVRHIHAQPFVSTQRNDRQSKYDRRKAPQDAPVKMIWYMNAEELMIIANKRLCFQADPETRRFVQMLCDEVIKVCPEFKGLLVPMCVYHNGKCHEMNPCGKADS